MLKKNWYLFVPFVLIAIPGLIFLFYTVKYGYTTAEAIEALRYFTQSQTRYAQKYSDDHFNTIKPGMDGRTVFELIGVPFERHNDDAEWIYALPQGTTPYYHERIVRFTRDKNNVPRVKETVKQFHGKP